MRSSTPFSHIARTIAVRLCAIFAVTAIFGVKAMELNATSDQEAQTRLAVHSDSVSK